MNKLKMVYKQMMERARCDMGNGHIGDDRWQWPHGVMLYGFVKAYEKTNDKEIYNFIKEWADFYIERGDTEGKSINTTAPLLGVMKLIECEKDNEKYIKIAKEFANWCLTEEPRCDLGTFEHTCTDNHYPNQIWADTLFMGCLFLIKWGLYTGERMYINEALRQFKLHYQFLKDEKTGLLYHGYYCDTREKKGVLWGRGNCWLAIAAIEALNLLDDSYKGYNDLKAIYNEHIMGVIACQSDEGGWHTVMDRDDTYIEMSATTAFAFSVKRAVMTGFLPEKYLDAAEKATKVVLDDINEAGEIMHGSIGTCVMEDYKKYNDIPYGYSYFSQGIAMMLLSL